MAGVLSRFNRISKAETRSGWRVVDQSCHHISPLLIFKTNPLNNINMTLSNETIERLQKDVEYAESYGYDMNDRSFGREEGCLISYNEAKAILASVKGEEWVDLGEWKIGRKVKITTIYEWEAGKGFDTYTGVVEWNQEYFCIQVKCDDDMVFMLSGTYWFGSITDQKIEWLS